jgi:hypothetical protein
MKIGVSCNLRPSQQYIHKSLPSVITIIAVSQTVEVITLILLECLIVIKCHMCINPPEAISMVYFINPSHQFYQHCSHSNCWGKYCDMTPEKRNSRARGTAAVRQRPCKQATVPEPLLGNGSDSNNGGTVGGCVFCAVCAVFYVVCPKAT